METTGVTRTSTHTARGRRGRVLLTVAGLVLMFIGFAGTPAGGQPDSNQFQGDDCTSTSANEGTCTIDEPANNANPDTYGTVHWERDGDEITFTINLEDPDGGDDPTLEALQICIQPANGRTDNPYTPTAPNTCAGNQSDRVYEDTSNPPLTVTLDLTQVLGSDFESGERIFFALHMDIDDDGEDRTVYVVGASPPLTAALTVAKQVENDPNVDGTSFSFTLDCDVALDDSNNDSAGVTYDNDGDASFSLGDDDTETFTGLAPGTDCEVVEADPGTGWSTTTSGGSNPDQDRTVFVSVDTDTTVTYTNRFSAPPETFDLTVGKQVDNDPDAQGTSFSFTVDCSVALSTANNDSAGVTYDADGDASFSLGDDDTETFTNIPDGTTCAVTEADPGTGWSTTTSGGSNPDADRTVDVVVDDDRTVTFTNVFTPGRGPTTRSLTVTKDVIDDPATAGTEFAFTVDCSVALSTANNASAGVTYDADGDASFSLGDGDSETFSGIADGATCTVTEADPGADWSTTTSGGSNPDGDRTVDVALTADRSVTFTNDFEGAVLGGGEERPSPQPQPQPQPQPDVQPQEQARQGERLEVRGVQQLPRTGSTTGPLVRWGVALIGAGLVLVGGTRPPGKHYRRRRLPLPFVS